MHPCTRGGSLKGATATQGDGLGGTPRLPGEGSLSPQISGWAARGLISLDARNVLSLLDPIHLPSSRGERTPVALPDPLAWPFLVKNIDYFGFHSCGPNACGSHYSGLGCNGREVTAPSADPSMRDPWKLTHVLLTLQPIHPHTRAAPGPWSQVWFPILQVVRSCLSGAWNQV